MFDNFLANIFGGKHLFLLIVTTYTLCSLCNCNDKCLINNVDYSGIEKFGPWEVVSDDGNRTYKINLCGPVQPIGKNKQDCHGGTAVCMIHNGQALSVANFTTYNLTAERNDKLGEIWIIRQGDACPEKPGYKLNSMINLKCGKTLGVPRFLDYTYCTSYFEWRTNLACKNVPVSEKEVPCYVYDDQGQIHDLSALIKPKGGYLVDSSDGWDFYINVCQDISPDNSTSRCPAGSAACRFNKTTVIDMGHPQRKLQRSASNDLTLQYTSDTSVPGCTVKPSTTIQFVCPDAGGSKDPLLEFDFNCQFRVLWKTEHACAETVVSSTKSCRIQQESRNIDIDLTPLTNSPGVDKPYEVYVPHSKDNPSPMRYYLNVCGELGIQCPDENSVRNVAVCQTKVGDSSYGHILGKTYNQKLKYVDGELTLTYKGGEKCNHNLFQRTTIITFHCNHTAGNKGKGWPVFNREEDCTYLFDWDTKYACLDHPVVEECRVNHNGKRYDLSPLVKHSGTNWNVLEGGVQAHHLNMYYINVCNDILPEDQAKRCKSDSSVCVIDDKGVHSLGRYTNNPIFDPKSNTIQITYRNGDMCRDNTRRKSSIITFICKPGDLESGPIFLRHSLDECLYEFEWHTAAACVLSRETGKDCKLYDEDLGINFDLNRLTKDKGSFYNVSDKSYDYLLNLCGSVVGTPCDKKTPVISNPGVCQVKHGGTVSDSFVTGQANSTLSYYDGIIKLKYENGANYNSKPPVPRRTEIAMICDRKAGPGTPKFVDEGKTSKGTYTFSWSTEYACPNTPVECTATAGNKQYDLSSLTRTSTQNNWAIVDDSDQNSKKKFYINVCSSLKEVSVGSGCSPFAAVCQTGYQGGKEILLPGFSNLGEVKSGPTVEGDGRLSLKYTTVKEECNDFNKKNNFTTTIHFVCKKGALSKGPNRPLKIGNCEYSFLWETEAACPITDTEKKGNNCVIKDRNSEYTFNLFPLQRKGSKDYYEIQGPDSQKIRLNLCGSISSNNCAKVENSSSAACLVDLKGNTHGLASINHILDYSEDGRLLMKFDGIRAENGKRKQVIISFLCRQTIPLGQPEFVRKENDITYYFDFKTSLACRPQPVDCLVQDDSGTQYDLSPLARTGTNWQVIDTRADHSDLTYYINVCRPINKVIGTTCPGGPVGGCQVSHSSGSYNMGYIQSQPVVSANGTLTLLYTNGDMCHKGKPNQSYRSTRINFFCSTTEHNPTFEGETETCEYIFNWLTPAACAIQRTTGQNCRVKDPVYNFEFDLNGLHKAGADYQVPAGEYIYQLNVCGPLATTSLCADKTVAVCQTKPANKAFKFDAGHTSTELVYDAGEITLTYSGGKACHQNKFNRSTVITFVCDQSKNGSAGPNFINETFDCTYQFEWPTSLACTPFKSEGCAISDSNGKQYDLSSLSRSDDNYDTIDHISKKKFLFNVCRSLVPQKGETCPFNSAACIVDLDVSDPKKKYHNIGEVNKQQIQFLDGRLQLLYTNGEICSDDKTKHTSTRIIFSCNKNSIDTSPVGHFKVGCEHRFLWETSAACPLGSSVATGGNCTVANPNTGYTFDLQSLKKSSGYAVNDDKNGHVFNLNVCDKVTGTLCTTATQTGACQIEKGGMQRKFNAGNANSNLQYDDGILFLNYSGGDSCHNNQFKRNVIISFICSESAGKGHPQFIAETYDCTYQFVWYTSLTCEKQVKCSVDTDDRTIDLSPLIKKTGHHLAVPTQHSANSTFYINVCRPLNPIYGKLCPPGSSVCLEMPGKDPMSLGKSRSPPVYDKATGKITLIYDHGSKCPTNGNKNISTKIIFNCKPGPSMGQPLFEYYADCQYIFEWDTNVVCRRNKTEIKKANCVYVDPLTRVTYNLTGLRTDQPLQVPNDKNDGIQYLVNICGGLGSKYPGCEDASICSWNQTKAMGQGYGKSTSSTFIISENKLKLVYEHGVNCKKNQKLAFKQLTSRGYINFECDLYTYPGKPLKTYLSPCEAVLSWPTRAVCPTIADDCTVAYNGHVYDLSVLSRQKGSWNLTDLQGNMYWINICQGVHDAPDKTRCPNTASSCRRTKSGILDNLGMVTSQNLRMDGDGKTIVLEYTSNDLACANVHRRSDNLQTKTIIKFECGDTVGGPVFIPRKENNNDCTFEFKWKSTVACSIKRHTVVEKSGKIHDTESNNIMDISHLYNMQRITIETKQYEISLAGNGTRCGANTVVCEVDTSLSSHSAVGTRKGRQFFIEDDIVEVVLNTEKVCYKNEQKKVRSIIQFHCNSQLEKPLFLFESLDCTYMFTWENPFTCPHPVVVNPHPLDISDESVNHGNKGSSGVKAKTVGTIVAVFLSAIIICILLIVFHKKERRSALASRIRRIFRRDSSVYRYNALSTEDHEEDGLLPHITADDLDLQGSVEPADNDERNILVQETIPPSQSYHDDSDEELLA